MTKYKVSDFGYDEYSYVVDKDMLTKIVNIGTIVFLNITKEQQDEFFKAKENEELYNITIEDFCNENNIEYKGFSEEYYMELAELESIVKKYKVAFSDVEECFYDSNDYLSCDMNIAITYLDGSNWVYKYVNINEELTKVTSDLYYWETQRKVNQLDMYLNNDEEILVVYNSYYAGELDTIEGTFTNFEEFKTHYEDKLSEEYLKELKALIEEKSKIARIKNKINTALNKHGKPTGYDCTKITIELSEDEISIFNNIPLEYSYFEYLEDTKSYIIVQDDMFIL